MSYVEVLLHLKVNNRQENNNKQAFALFYSLICIIIRQKTRNYNQLKERLSMYKGISLTTNEK